VPGTAAVPRRVGRVGGANLCEARNRSLAAARPENRRPVLALALTFPGPAAPLQGAAVAFSKGLPGYTANCHYRTSVQAVLQNEIRVGSVQAVLQNEIRVGGLACSASTRYKSAFAGASPRHPALRPSSRRRARPLLCLAQALASVVPIRYAAGVGPRETKPSDYARGPALAVFLGHAAGFGDIHSCAMTVEDLYLAACVVPYISLGQ
jgi:hypothetical protein